MTTKQEHRFNMYLTVRDFLTQNEPITKELPNFAENFTILKETISTIQLFGEQQKSDKTGIAKLKNKIKEDLITMAADNSRKIAALAKFSNNIKLLNEVKFSQSDLGKVTDVALKDYAQIIYDKAAENIEALAHYGITAETQKIFIETINSYNASIAKPRVGITEKRQATKELIKLFDAADNALINIDYAADIVRLTQTSFYNGYKTARKLVETSSGYLSLKAIARETETGEPVRGVTFIFKHNGTRSGGTRGNGEIVKKTAEKGSFNVKNMPAGTYQVVVNKPGYKEKVVTVSVADGRWRSWWWRWRRGEGGSFASRSRPKGCEGWRMGRREERETRGVGDLGAKKINSVELRATLCNSVLKNRDWETG